MPNNNTEIYLTDDEVTKLKNMIKNPESSGKKLGRFMLYATVITIGTHILGFILSYYFTKNITLETNPWYLSFKHIAINIIYVFFMVWGAVFGGKATNKITEIIKK